MTIRRLVALAAAGASLAGVAACSASGPVYQDAPAAPEGKGIVYIYRPAGGPWGGRDTHFYIGDANVADLSSNGYTWFYLPEGNYTIRLELHRGDGNVFRRHIAATEKMQGKTNRTLRLGGGRLALLRLHIEMCCAYA